MGGKDLRGTADKITIRIALCNLCDFVIRNAYKVTKKHRGPERFATRLERFQVFHQIHGSAKGAGYESQGQARSASPLVLGNTRHKA